MKTEAPCKLASSYYERRMIENEWSQNKYTASTHKDCGLERGSGSHPSASPAIGRVHYEVLEGGITGEAMLEFMKSMMAAYLQCGGFGSVREIAFITGNASIHHREIVTEYLQETSG
ncbi:hypothetical protein PC112_g17594 [Phytophthora cactorum]|nr:hypothetical protein PC112_g17594 [Phytophthora cactorum]